MDLYQEIAEDFSSKHRTQPNDPQKICEEWTKPNCPKLAIQEETFLNVSCAAYFSNVKTLGATLLGYFVAFVMIFVLICS